MLQKVLFKGFFMPLHSPYNIILFAVYVTFIVKIYLRSSDC